MTALDQAFINAYRQHDAVPMAAPVATAEFVRPSEPFPEEPMPAASQPFQPLLQVDGFAWPDSCRRLSAVAETQLDALAEGLIAPTALGRKVFAACGCRRGSGCTTLLLCAAQRLARRGLRAILVDADFEQPQLARRLGLLPDSGWEDVLDGQLPLGEVVIESVDDHLAILPLCGKHAGADGSLAHDPAAEIDVLREHYDLVLVDLGRFAPADGPAAQALCGAGRWIDAAVIVRDVRNANPPELDRLCDRLRRAGIAEAGLADNFV
ncbi:MAG: hypothetical protein HUU20_18370 [Pirellulales bacterium]|nr:hypothetical protein [Pirellulales bacterium]